MGDKVRAFVTEVKKDKLLEMSVREGMGTPKGQTSRNTVSISIINCLEDPDINPEVAALFHNTHLMMSKDVTLSKTFEGEGAKEDVEFNEGVLKAFEDICSKVGISLEK